MAKKISQLTQATEVKSDDVTVIVQDGETKKLPLNMMVTKQDIENKKIAGLAKLDEIEATYENDTYTPTITVKNKSSVKTGEGDEVDYSANVMDGHAKSAILTGQTLVNVALTQYMTPSNNASINGETITLDLSRQWSLVEFSKDNTLLIPNEVYTCILYDVVGDTTNVNFSIQNGSSTKLHLKDVGYKFKFTMGIGNDLTNRLCYVENLVATSGTVSFKMVLLKGDYTNVDIPYFTGMQSVKLPVLTTIGKNLFDINHFSKLENWDGKTSSERPYYAYEMKLKPNTSYTFSRKENSIANNIYFCISKKQGVYDWTGGIIHPTDTSAIYQQRTITTDSIGILYFNLYQAHKELANLIPLLEDAQLEEASVSTSYEPYKTNILTVNEDVTLRGIGDVKDTLDCATGEVTQRVGEYVITGEESWGNTSSANGYFAMVFNDNQNLNRREKGKIQCNKLKVLNNVTISDEYIYSGNAVYMSFSRTRVADRTAFINHLKGEFANGTPYVIQYELATPVIKTVDLMPSGTHPSTTPYCWKNGHIQLSSSGLLPNLEYSVVTSRAGQINQNATMIVKNDKRIFDLEILLAGGLVNTTYQALILQNQVETGLSKVSLSSETEPDYLLYHMIMKLIEEKAYKLDDLTEKVSVFYLYEKLSDEQFETIYSALYPFVEDEIVEEPVVEELPEVVEDEVIM